MKASETFHAEERKRSGISAEIEKAREEKEKKDIELPQILADKRLFEAFGMVLKRDGYGEDLGIRLKEGKLTKEDYRKLDGSRRSLLELKEQWENLGKLIDSPALLKDVIRVHPEFKGIIKSAGEQNIKEVVNENLARLAIEEPVKFMDLGEAIQKLSLARKMEAEDDKEIDNICLKYGINQKKYTEAILDEHPEEKLEEIIANKFGWIKKWRYRRDKEKFADEIKNNIAGIKTAEELRERRKEIEKQLEAIGGLLHGTLTENDAIRNSLNIRLSGEREALKESDIAFNEMRRPTNEDLESFFQAAKKRYDKANPKHKMDSLPPAAYNELLEEFNEEFVATSVRGRMGFWTGVKAAIWSSLSRSFLSSKSK